MTMKQKLLHHWSGLLVQKSIAITLLFFFSTFWIKDVTAQNYNQVTNRVTVSVESLSSPYWLTITPSAGANLQGEIRLNNKVIQRLSSAPVRLNLSPYLRPGNNHLEIQGVYGPENTNISVSLVGSNTDINQTVEGNGRFRQIIDFEVR